MDEPRAFLSRSDWQTIAVRAGCVAALVTFVIAFAGEANPRIALVASLASIVFLVIPGFLHERAARARDPQGARLVSWLVGAGLLGALGAIGVAGQTVYVSGVVGKLTVTGGLDSLRKLGERLLDHDRIALAMFVRFPACAAAAYATALLASLTRGRWTLRAVFLGGAAVSVVVATMAAGVSGLVDRDTRFVGSDRWQGATAGLALAAAPAVLALAVVHRLTSEPHHAHGAPVATSQGPCASARLLLALALFEGVTLAISFASRLVESMVYDELDLSHAVGWRGLDPRPGEGALAGLAIIVAAPLVAYAVAIGRTRNRFFRLAGGIVGMVLLVSAFVRWTPQFRYDGSLERWWTQSAFQFEPAAHVVVGGAALLGVALRLLAGRFPVTALPPRSTAFVMGIVTLAGVWIGAPGLLRSFQDLREGRPAKRAWSLVMAEPISSSEETGPLSIRYRGQSYRLLPATRFEATTDDLAWVRWQEGGEPGMLVGLSRRLARELAERSRAAPAIDAILVEERVLVVVPYGGGFTGSTILVSQGRDARDSSIRELYELTVGDR